MTAAQWLRQWLPRKPGSANAGCAGFDPAKPAPAKQGHFGLFVRYYLIVVLIYALVVVGGISAWLSITAENSRGYGEAQLRGTHYLIEQRYLGAPREEWPALGEELSEHFAYPVRLAPLAELRESLTPREYERVLRGEVVMESEDEAYTYQRLPGSDQAVALGNFDDVMVQGVPWSDLDLIDSIVILAMYFLAIALPLYFLVYRFWRDLRRLRTTAEALSAGELDARAPEVTTRLVNPLGHALNQMAGQVQQVLESQRILAQAVAHEIRTPLARMRFGLEMLEQAGGEEERAHLREGLETDIQRLEHLASHSVAYARIGRMVGIERAPVSVSALLADLADVFDPEPPLLLSFDSGGIDSLSAHREALELALRNLIGNALRHARTRVAVSAARTDEGYALCVDDDGEGVPEAERERVFQPFAQLRKHPEGFGLGLALVRVVAEKHGGRATVGESALGGARFRIDLPAQ
jgi:two-component system sensor histidine kinase RstB